MANEITVTTRFQLRKGSLTCSKQATTRADFAGTHYAANTLSIPTTSAGTSLAIGANVATAGCGYLVNTSDTNYVEIGVQVSGTFYPVMKLKPGECFPIRAATTALYARANTAAVDLEYFLLED